MIIKFNGYDIEATVDEVRALLTDAATEKVIVQAPEKPVKKAPRKKELDMDKIKALRNAGWSTNDIASEMRVSATTITNRLREEEE